MRKRIENWEEIFKKHQQSGKSIPAFCDEIGIHPNTFYKHKKRIRSCGDTAVIEIKPVFSSTTAPIVLKTKKFIISISNGFDEAQLKSVLKVIGELE